ncbi:unnamed protein product [Schistosoma turkestanicum]|nr:unnamed protein product [Schistosoma turkestanicum]
MSSSAKIQIDTSNLSADDFNENSRYSFLHNIHKNVINSHHVINTNSQRIMKLAVKMWFSNMILIALMVHLIFHESIEEEISSELKTRVLEEMMAVNNSIKTQYNFVKQNQEIIKKLKTSIFKRVPADRQSVESYSKCVNEKAKKNVQVTLRNVC